MVWFAVAELQRHVVLAVLGILASAPSSGARPRRAGCRADSRRRSTTVTSTPGDVAAVERRARRVEAGRVEASALRTVARSRLSVSSIPDASRPAPTLHVARCRRSPGRARCPAVRGADAAWRPVPCRRSRRSGSACHRTSRSLHAAEHGPPRALPPRPPPVRPPGPRRSIRRLYRRPLTPRCRARTSSGRAGGRRC